MFHKILILFSRHWLGNTVLTYAIFQYHILTRRKFQLRKTKTRNLASIFTYLNDATLFIFDQIFQQVSHFTCSFLDRWTSFGKFHRSSVQLFCNFSNTQSFLPPFFSIYYIFAKMPLASVQCGRSLNFDIVCKMSGSAFFLSAIND